MLYFHLTVYGEADILNHLSGIQLGNQYAFYLVGVCGNGFGWERPQSDGAKHSDLEAFFARHFHGFLADTRHGAESYNQVFGILAVNLFKAYLVLFDFFVFGLEADVVLLHLFRFQFQRSDDVGLAAVGSAGSGPRTLLDNFGIRAARLLCGKNYLLHHLSDYAVGKDDSRIAVLEGKLEAQAYEVCHFLYGSGGKCDKAIVTVAAAFHGLEIVGLAWLDGSSPGPPRITFTIRHGNSAPAM